MTAESIRADEFCGSLDLTDDETNEILGTAREIIDAASNGKTRDARILCLAMLLTVFLAMLLASSDIFLRCYQHPSEPEFLDMCRSVYAEYVNLPRKPPAGTQAS